MSEATSTPAAPATTSSAPAASATPAASSAAASAPAAAPAAAPASTTETVAGVSAAGTTQAAAKPDTGKTTLQVMQEAQAAKEAEAAAAAAAGTEKKEEAPVETVAEKTAEEVAAEAEAEAAAAAAKGDDDETDDTDADIPSFDDFELDPVALAPKELAGKIETDPALAAALEANPELKNEIFGNARLAAETAQFKEVFGSPEEAKVAAEGHAKFASISSAMLGIDPNDVNSIRPVMQQMLEASALRGPEGELQYDKSGALVTDGSVGRFLRTSFQQRAEMLAEKYKAAGDEEGLAAIDILMEREGLRAPSSASESEEGMSEAVRTQLNQLKAEREALAQEKQAAAAEAAKTYNTTVNTRIDAMMDAGISSLLSRATGLNDFSRKTVEQNIRLALQKEISKNPRFQDEIDKIDKLPYGPERQKKHMALATRYFQTGLARVAGPELAKAGSALTAKQQAQAEKSAARAEAARSETRGSMSATKAVQTISEKDQLATVEADLRKTLGRSPSNFEILSENLKRKSQTAA